MISLFRTRRGHRYIPSRESIAMSVENSDNYQACPPERFHPGGMSEFPPKGYKQNWKKITKNDEYLPKNAVMAMGRKLTVKEGDWPESYVALWLGLEPVFGRARADVLGNIEARFELGHQVFTEKDVHEFYVLTHDDDTDHRFEWIKYSEAIDKNVHLELEFPDSEPLNEIRCVNVMLRKGKFLNGGLPTKLHFSVGCGVVKCGSHETLVKVIYNSGGLGYIDGIYSTLNGKTVCHDRPSYHQQNWPQKHLWILCREPTKFEDTLQVIETREKLWLQKSNDPTFGVPYLEMCTIVCSDEKTFRCPKFILATDSEYFCDLFRSLDMNGQGLSDTISIPMHSWVFKILLTNMLVGKFPKDVDIEIQEVRNEILSASKLLRIKLETFKKQ